MVKHTQIIRRQKPTNYLSVFDHFVGLALKRLSLLSNTIYLTITLLRPSNSDINSLNVKVEQINLFAEHIE